MCAHGDTVDMLVPVMADDAWEGVTTWKIKPVDRCLSDIVAALNAAGILTRSCCCGHDRVIGWNIVLHDGRRLRVYPEELPCPQ